jgi:CPA1 family monovalent cation:H+ antiporter
MLAMSDTTREHLDMFWELIDEILNAVLFMLIGFELIVIALHPGYFLVGLAGILVALVGRFISVGIPIWLLRLRQSFMRGTVRVLTWGGLRGGISIALALSLPLGQERDLIVAVTYVVVIFSVLVQGLTFGRVLKIFDQPDPIPDES